MSGPELKPCPFCWGEAIIINEDRSWIECADCHSKVASGPFDCEDDAIAAWNTRAPVDYAALPEVQAMITEAVAKEREALKQARETNKRFQRRIQLLEGWWQRRVERANNATGTYLALLIADARGRLPNLKAVEEAAYQRGYAEGRSEHHAIRTRRGPSFDMPSAAIRKRGEG